MALPIEDYALIGDTHTAALVGLDGSIDWLCVPRFDSGACFAALLGDRENGRWQLAPTGAISATRRRYVARRARARDRMGAPTPASSRVTDFMPLRTDASRPRPPGRRASAARSRWRWSSIVRFDYGRLVPWVRRVGGDLVRGRRARRALCCARRCRLHGEDLAHGRRVHGQRRRLRAVRPVVAARRTSRRASRRTRAARSTRPLSWWHEWCERAAATRASGATTVRRSLMTLKALTYRADRRHRRRADDLAAEAHRRRAQLGLPLLLAARRRVHAVGAQHRRLQRGGARVARLAAARRRRRPDQLQIMYGVSGERRLTEHELAWLAGYEGSRPVRIGNAASDSSSSTSTARSLDALHLGASAGHGLRRRGVGAASALVEFVEIDWSEPDEGIWEVRGPRRHFTHSKVMAWVGARPRGRGGRAVRPAKGRSTSWRAGARRDPRRRLRERLRRRAQHVHPVLRRKELDASLLMIPLVRLPAGDRPARARHASPRSSAS